MCFVKHYAANYTLIPKKEKLSKINLTYQKFIR